MRVITVAVSARTSLVAGILGGVVEPITLAAVSALTLTEGVKFLYGQAGDFLRMWRERKRAGKSTPPPAPVRLPDALEGRLEDAAPDIDIVERLSDELAELRRAFLAIADEGEEIDPTDEDTLIAVDALRSAVEAVYGRSLTFRGESRTGGGAEVHTRVEVETVQGRVAGLRARRVAGGTLRSSVRATTVESGAELTGADIDTIE